MKECFVNQKIYFEKMREIIFSVIYEKSLIYILSKNIF
jgi:hypothetical protein